MMIWMYIMLFQVIPQVEQRQLYLHQIQPT
jgi:hypothetical protein